MIGRRQIREKALQALYAYYTSTNSAESIIKNFYKIFHSIYDLYIFQLNFLLEIKHQYELKIEEGKKKNFPTYEDLHPNTRLLENPILILIENNTERRNYTEKHKELTWDFYSHYAKKALKRILKSQFYQKYLDSKVGDFETEKEFVIKIFDKTLADNSSIHELYETMQLSWADDFHIANSMTYKTIASYQPDSPNQTLLKEFKDEEDRKFFSELILKTLSNLTQINAIIEKKIIGWDLERVPRIDRIILELAICEYLFFDIPAPVLINEYVELSKVFSSEKSRLYINGILDSFTKENLKS